jgi:probable rRNA maturation factor
MVEVINRQRKITLDCEPWRTFAGKALSVTSGEGSSVTIAFVSDRAMRKLNRRWRTKQGTTDVLSFPAGGDKFAHCEEQMLGDIVISAEQAALQAKQNRLTFDQEVAQLILHGLLHLCGYDHETDTGEMNREELRLRKKLGIEG